jgi:hypothetical protein
VCNCTGQLGSGSQDDVSDADGIGNGPEARRHEFVAIERDAPRNVDEAFTKIL